MKMRSNTDQYTEKYLHKLGVLHTFVLDIIGAETFEEVANHVIDALEATIDPFIIAVGRVQFGVIQGYVKVKGLEIRPIKGEAMPLDGRGIIIRAVNTRKICNVPDTREDPDYVLHTEDAVQTLSEIAAPILSHGKSIGVVNIEDSESHAFDESDQEILKALPGYAGFAIPIG